MGPAVERPAQRQAGDLLLRAALAEALPGGFLYGPLAARRREDRGARRQADAARECLRGAQARRLGRGEWQGSARTGPRACGGIGARRPQIRSREGGKMFANALMERWDLGPHPLQLAG